nr:M24 family metallopeptidase [Aliiglaciecola lipolytica]
MTFLLFVICSTLSRPVSADILSMRDRAQLTDQILEDRLQNILPDLMAREEIDMWILISREYNEDPVLKTMLPATWLSARRRTILVLYNPGEGKPIERLAVSRYAVDSLFKKGWDKEKQPNQWERLVEIIKQKNPNKIGLNKSTHFALADGMSATEFEELHAALPTELKSKVVSSEKLAVAWLETRSEQEMAVYPELIQIGRKLIAQAFSNQVITPGKTSTDDVVWWLREKSREMKLTNWFHPSVSLQRSSTEKFNPTEAFSGNKGSQIIQPGDLLHVDFGLVYLRLHSDQQQHAYVLKKGETDAPEYIKEAFKKANQLQDILTDNFVLGRTGNQVLKMSREEAIKAGIKPTIYTHPLGYHGHAAGTTIGMWDSQGGVAVQGDHPLHYNTVYSIELNAASFIPEWKKEIRIMLEENAYFDESGVTYMDGRQTKLHLITSD